MVAKRNSQLTEQSGPVIRKRRTSNLGGHTPGHVKEAPFFGGGLQVKVNFFLILLLLYL